MPNSTPYVPGGASSTPPPFAFDAAGNLKVSNSRTLANYVLSNDNQSNFFNQINVGTGAQSYNSVNNSQELTVVTGGDSAAFETKERHSYIAGNTQEAVFTAINFQPEDDVIKRLGYYSDDGGLDGCFLESSNGSVKLVTAKDGVITNTFEQTTKWNPPWNNPAEIAWENFQVYKLAFLYLGGTSLWFDMLFGANKVNEMYRHDHANLVADVIMGSPAQRLRAEIISTGGPGTLNFVCATVKTLGHVNIDYGTELALNNIPYHSNFIAAGSKLNAVAGDDVWLAGGVYTGQSSTVDNIEVISDSGNDALFGTGAVTFEITGLKSPTSTAYETEIVVIGTPSPSQWWRVVKTTVEDAGALGGNDGNITTRHVGTPANIFSVFPQGRNSSGLAVYTVPAKSRSVLKRLRVSVTKSGGSDATAVITLRSRKPGKVYLTLRSFEVSTKVPVNFTQFGGDLLKAGTDLKFKIEDVSTTGLTIGAVMEFNQGTVL